MQLEAPEVGLLAGRVAQERPVGIQAVAESAVGCTRRQGKGVNHVRRRAVGRFPLLAQQRRQGDEEALQAMQSSVVPNLHTAANGVVFIQTSPATLERGLPSAVGRAVE